MKKAQRYLEQNISENRFCYPEKKKKLSKNNLIMFFYSFLATSIIISLFSGFVIAEKNTRKIAFSDNSSLISLNSIAEKSYINVRILNKKFAINVTWGYNIINRVSELLSDSSEQTITNEFSSFI